jgi:TatD DNase family protein
MIIDTHCHLDNIKYQDDLDDVLEKSKMNDVQKIIIPGADPKDLKNAMEIAKDDNIYFAVGVHPYHTEDWNEEIFQFINSKKCVAIGECGLDYFRLPKEEKEKQAEIDMQKNIFRKQIQIAKKINKPLIVHIRDASEDAKQILIEEKADEVGGVLHCFNADETLLELADKNFYFGIGGVLTFKNAKKLVNVLPKIPLNKLVVETDAPYLTPHPHRGKRNEPSYTKLVVEKMSELLEMSVDEISKLTTENSQKLFNIYD